MRRRDLLKNFGLAAGALAAPPAIRAAPLRRRTVVDTLETRPFFFVQIADPQMGMTSGNENFEVESQRYQQAIGHCNRLRPAFVTVTGDLTNQPHHPEQIAEYLRIGQLIDPKIPLYHVAGNHDMQSSPAAEDRDKYIRTYGPDRYSFTYGSCLCLVLNSCLMTAPLHLEAEAKSQFDWAEALIKKRGKGAPGHVLVFQHHPNASLSWSQTRDYFDLFWEYDAGPVFVGHTHNNGSEVIWGIDIVITSSVGNPFSGPPGFRIVKVYPDRVEHAYHGLDAMPESVALEYSPASSWVVM